MNKLIVNIFVTCVLVLFVLVPSVSQARSLSITPTILEMFAVPGQSWDSTIKVINQNSDPLTVYAETVNFAPQGERGHGSFAPVTPQEAEGATLAEWMQVSEEPYVIPPEGSITVPVSIRVPADASPGGHYAAVMIGTRPPASGGTQVATAQIISSLFFVRIAGDVVEDGQIRSFRPASRFVQTPELDFSVRFENTGNVHLRPQGEIIITNMWGRERGVIPINQKTNFGNVLPESIRQFEFTWSGEPSFSDVGRYEATLALGYGSDQRTFVTARTHFWVIPVQPLLILFVSLLAIVWFASWCVRAYVRRMLLLSGVEPEHGRYQATPSHSKSSLTRLRAPLQDGVIDLRTHLTLTSGRLAAVTVLWDFIRRYQKFFVAVVGLIVVGVAVWWYFASVFVPGRNYDVTIGTNGQATTISSEEIMYDRADTSTDTSVDAVAKNETYTISVINTTDTPGKAVSVAQLLESNQYEIANVAVDTTERRSRSVILYRSEFADEALAISQLLDEVLLSALPEDAEEGSVGSDIRIFVGDE